MGARWPPLAVGRHGVPGTLPHDRGSPITPAPCHPGAPLSLAVPPVQESHRIWSTSAAPESRRPPDSQTPTTCGRPRCPRDGKGAVRGKATPRTRALGRYVKMWGCLLPWPAARPVQRHLLLHCAATGRCWPLIGGGEQSDSATVTQNLTPSALKSGIRPVAVSPLCAQKTVSRPSLASHWASSLVCLVSSVPKSSISRHSPSIARVLFVIRYPLLPRGSPGAPPSPLH